MRMLSASLIVASVGCGGSGDGGPSVTNPGGGGGTNPGGGGNNPGGPVATNGVAVGDNQFGPSAIKVAPGTTVTWTWDANSTTHNVTFPDGTGSGDKGAGATFTKTFSAAGTFGYQCTLHPGMTGTVQVQ